MRDFLPADVRKRNYVINIIKEVYESYGFEPLETPSVENIETLMGKYGEEGNQLVFKILKRGEKLDLVHAKSESDLSDLALRYDLTVPLARVVANNKNDLPKFFKRYQIQPVWRADRPARGRFREFYQCDVDWVGSNSLVVEVEIIAAASKILEKLGFEDFVVRVNHRALLQLILETAGVAEHKQTDALVALDKIDKIGRAGVERELASRGISNDVGNRLLGFFDFFILERSSRTFDDSQKRNLLEILTKVKEYENLYTEVRDYFDAHPGPLDGEVANLPVLRNFGVLCTLANTMSKNLSSSGLRELAEIVALSSELPFWNRIVVDPTLARGLSYYTGTIMEINVPDLAGSLGGGGRYDGLIGMFGKEQIPACGFSLGLERILVVMEERGMFPPEIAESTAADVLVTIWSEDTIAASLKLANELRSSGIRTTVYPEVDKLGKQIKYADSINVPYVCILGDDEIREGKVKLKNMKTGDETLLAASDVSASISK